MNPARTQARDRRLAAVHEAGHAVVAEHIGIEDVEAWIAPFGTQDSGTEKSWIGRCSWPRDWIEPHRRRLLAVAGLAAEQVWSQIPDGHPIGADTDALFDPDAMSRTDWCGTGCAPGEPDRGTDRALVKCVRLLATSLRGEWLAEARRLIEASRSPAPAPKPCPTLNLTPAEMAELMRQADALAGCTRMSV